MLITDAKKIREIQAEFNNKFPCLKLEFYKRSHEEGQGSPAKQRVDTEKLVGTIRTIHKEGDLSINGNMKVKTLESLFESEYGLHVQVFRKSGSLWLQTIATDEWTLTEQNKRGEASTQRLEPQLLDSSNLEELLGE